MKRWLLVEAVPGPESDVAGPLVTNPHTRIPGRYVGVKRSDMCKIQPEVIAEHPDLLKAIAKGCLMKLAKPVAAKTAAEATAMLRPAPPTPKPAPPRAAKEGK